MEIEAAYDIIMSPGGGLACVVMYQWWRIWNMTKTTKELYADIKDLNQQLLKVVGGRRNPLDED